MINRKRLRDYRRGKIQKIVGDLSLKGVILTETDNVRYLLDFDQPYQAIGFFNERYASIMGCDKEPTLLACPYGLKNYQDLNDWIHDIRLLRDYKDTLNYQDFLEDIASAMADHDMEEGAVGVDYMDFKVFNMLEKKFPNVNFISIYEKVLIERSVKNEDEVELIKESIRVAETGFEAAINNMKPGLTEYEIAGYAAQAMVSQGAEIFTHWPGIRSGRNTLYFKIWPSHTRVRHGDLMNMDLGCIVDGYCSDIHRTTVIGKATSIQKSVYQKLLSAHQKTIKSVKPGWTTNQMIRFFMAEMENDGLANYCLPFGHGLGMRLLEYPFVGLHASDLLIKQGHVICWEPRVGLQRNPVEGWGIAKELGGEIVLEDDFLVTEDGTELLSFYPYEDKFLD